MAKKRKTGTEEAAQIGEKKLRQLLKEAKSASQDAHEITSSLGGKIASAVENDHLHKKAFATLRMLDKMTPEKLADYWDTLLYYMDISGLDERAKSAPRLSLENGKGEDGEEDDEEAPAAEAKPKGADVKPFPKPTSVQH